MFVFLGGNVGAEDQTALLADLEKNFSSIQTVQTNFKQEKALKIFNRTIEMDGRIVLENPGKLAWRIDSPIKYVLILNGKQAIQWDEDSNKIQKQNTSGDPIFEEVIGQIEKWFSGEFGSLLNDYDLTVKKTQPPELHFVPKAGSMVGKVIRSVTISVREDRTYVEKIVIEDRGGDQTSITFV
ncbi:MAG: outer membrane lipoprotein carrier protein LolA, partial [Kiritimatiellaceae bacterium]|nr:outer membrane lipoprotein carrier protein LolA [Kiritimatiellaceae bacterium]